MRRVFGIVAASLAVLLVAAVALLYWLLSGDGVRSAIEQQASAWLGQPVTIASARVSLWPRVAIGLRQVGIGSPARLRLAQVDLAASPLALLARRVEDAEIRIRNSRLDLPLRVGLPVRRSGPRPGATAVRRRHRSWQRPPRQQRRTASASCPSARSCSTTWWCPAWAAS